jgi:hypothetical protein
VTSHFTAQDGVRSGTLVTSLILVNCFFQVVFFFFFLFYFILLYFLAVLGLELGAYTLSHSTSPFCEGFLR